jgi:hypothetical protein
MLNNLGVHITKYPSGRFGFVGSLPATLGNEQPATKADCLGGRAYKDANGNYVAMHFPAFDTPTELVQHAKERQVELCAASGCACRTHI